MTRVFLAAGVAALAIAAPASADPHGGHGGGGQAQHQQRGGGGHAPAMQMRGGGGGHGPAMQMRGGQGPAVQFRGGGHAVAEAHGGGRFAMPIQRQQRAAAPRAQHGRQVQMAQQRRMEVNRQAGRHQAQQRMAQQHQMQANRHQAQQRMAEQHQMQANRHQAQQRMAEQRQMQANRHQAEARMAQQHQIQANRQQSVRMAQERQMQANRQQQLQARMAQQQQVRGNRFAMDMNQRVAANQGVGYGVGGCPPGLAGKGCMPPGLARQQQMQALRMANPDVFRASRIQMLAPRTEILGPAEVVQYVGQPVSALSSVVPLAALPASLGYLYPATPNYYYQYGGGYMYQVDRGTSLIDALIPLLAGGYMPGTYLPSSYMSSYVPDSYGLSSFYPASYGPNYGYGYDNLCNRYAYGVIYQVDCATGMVDNVVPVYAGGYGVGQMLPSAYNYYNVPMQYRNIYYPTSDYSYWYAPGAIYQYDPSTSLITSVAALMSPGFSIGQPLPAGYGMYNVPMAYRSTYYDTPNAWYRYNNGYIYQVDPTTQLVTAIVASLLT